MSKHLFNAPRLAPIQVDSLQTPFIFLSAIVKQLRREHGVTAHAECLMQPTAQCQQGQSSFRAASHGRAHLLLCRPMGTGTIKNAVEVALSNPSTINRYFLPCYSEEISINMPEAQDYSRNLLASCFYLHPF